MAIREINLVPVEVLNRLYSGRHLIFWAGCLIFSLSLVSGFYLYQDRVALAQKRPMITMEDPDSHLISKIEAIKKMQEELERLHQKNSAINAIIDRPAYSHILLRLALLMSGNTWLTHLAMEQGRDKDNTVNLSITGNSSHNEELGEFLNELSSEPLFKAVSLKYAKEKKMSVINEPGTDPIGLINFQIHCTVSTENR